MHVRRARTRSPTCHETKYGQPFELWVRERALYVLVAAKQWPATWIKSSKVMTCSGLTVARPSYDQPIYKTRVGLYLSD